MPVNDRTLYSRLARLDGRWRRRMDTMLAEAQSDLSKLFGSYAEKKRSVIMGFLSQLQTNEFGVIENSSENEATLMRLMRAMEALNTKEFATTGKFNETIRSHSDDSARMGIRKALDSVAIGEPLALPSTTYRGVSSMALARDMSTHTFSAIKGRANMDVEVLRQNFMRRIVDPDGTVENLTRDLANSGQIEGMLDSAGRRITVDERADRIARYEFAQVAQQSSEQAIGDFYFGGDYDPKKVTYLWFTVLDGREQDTHRDRHGRALTAEQWDERDFGDGTFGGPPLRPRCRCNRTFIMPHWFSEETQQRMAAGEPIVEEAREEKAAAAAAEAAAEPKAAEQPVMREQPSSAFPVANSQGVDTKEMFTLPGGGFTPERQALHNELVAERLAGKTPVPEGKRVVTVMGGGPATGKSRMIEKAGIGGENIVHSDPDSFKIQLPEFKELSAAGDKSAAAFVHEESSYLAKRTIADAVDAGYDVVVDGTGDNSYESLAKKVAGYRANGHRIVAQYITTDTDVAYARMLERAKKTGRYVPENYLRDVHRQVSVCVERALEDGLYDELTVWDNNGEKLVMIATARGKDLTVHNEALWQRFLAKAKPPRDLGAPFKELKGSAWYGDALDETIHAHEVVRAEWLAASQKFSQYEQEAVEFYQSYAYADINNALRTGEVRDSRVRGWLFNLEGAFKKAAYLDTDTYTYRGASVTNEVARQLFGGEGIPRVGQVFSEAGYMSVSHSQHVLRNFTKSLTDAQGINVRMRVRVPGGTKAIVMKNTGTEMELVLPKGSKVRILSVTQSVEPVPNTKYKRIWYDIEGEFIGN